MELSERTEGQDFEVKAAQGREGEGELPRTFFESYVAMANSHGGVILLGVEEQADGQFKAIGIGNPGKVLKALWDGLNNRQRVSANILAPEQAAAVEVDGKSIIEVRVPRATRQQRPLFVGPNPLEGTYIRSHEGDYHCPEEMVRRMLAEQIEDSRDSRLLPGFDLGDLDTGTFERYRRHFKNRQPDHPWNGLDDREFLRSLGGWRRDRQSGDGGLTAAGLLMFGQFVAIREAFPFYMVDYQERPEAKTEERWVDRLVPDGTWSGNLFDFYQQVIQRLYRDLKVPFRLKGDERVDETPVHEALREALVNALIHADYTGRPSVLVVKRPDLFGFRNPGDLRVPVDVAIQGGNSDCRNRALQTMFRLVGLGEQSGSGIPKIFRAWSEQHWRAPKIEDTQQTAEQTLCRLPLISLLPDATLTSLQARFGSAFQDFAEIERLALAAVSGEGSIPHARLREMTTAHSRDVTLALDSLVRRKILERGGRGRSAYYFFPGEPPAQDRTALSFFVAAGGEPAQASAQAAVSSPEHLAPSSEHSAPPSSEHSAPGSEHSAPLGAVLEQVPAALQNLVQRLHARRRVPEAELESALIALCAGEFRTLPEIARLCNRAPDTLRTHYLARMVRDGRMVLRFPETPTHPDQGYRTA
jgi:ATP-dependent DNA helicase RecG